jgi:hypothetical protein
MEYKIKRLKDFPDHTKESCYAITEDGHTMFPSDVVRKLRDSDKVLNSPCNCYNKNQIGGDHYSQPIQPIEYIQKNNLSFCEGSVVKYISRHRKKNGKEDLLKAKHYIDMIIDHEYGGQDD